MTHPFSTLIAETQSYDDSADWLFWLFILWVIWPKKRKPHGRRR